MLKKLMLVEIKTYPRKDGTKGAKLIFLDANDMPYTAYTDPEKAEEYREEICDQEEFNPARAREYSVSRDVYNGTLTQTVVLPDNSL